MKHTPSLISLFMVLFLVSLACSLSPSQSTAPQIPTAELAATLPPPPTLETLPTAAMEPTTAPATTEPNLPTETPEPTIAPQPTAIVHNLVPKPTFPDGKPSVTYDQESIRLAAYGQAYAGDEFLRGKFERPFDREMKYIPYIDIKQVNMVRSKDEEFIYVSIFLQEDPALLAEQDVGYGLELDSDLDGTGDLLIWTRLPATADWSVEGVSVWKDSNADVGGRKPLISELEANGDGYEVKVFDSGAGSDSDLAWSRIDPKDPKLIQIAFRRSLVQEPGLFLWSAWAIKGPEAFSLFDHNDHFTYEAAGSPVKSDGKYFPLKELCAMDNTCRIASGFTPKGYEPGVCPIPPPEKAKKNCTEYCFNTGSQTICVDVCD